MSFAPRAKTGETAAAVKVAVPAKLAATNLRIGERDGPFEQEADSVTDAIMADRWIGPEWSLSHMTVGVPAHDKCACGGSAAEDECEQCKAPRQLQRKAADLAARRPPPIVHDVLKAPGRPLDRPTRKFFETRLGRDLGHVRIHSDARAADSAMAVHALAYTVGNDIVFGNARYSPETYEGRHLIAHELVHVLQQSTTILRRTPSPEQLAQYDQKVSAIRSIASYGSLPPAAKAVADDIITRARPLDNNLYYIDNLKVLFSTPYQAPAQTGAASRTRASTEVAQEQARLATPEGQRLKTFEETASADRARVWTTRTGRNGKTFKVDNSDPNNIVVQIKIFLTKAGGGTDADVTDVRSLEDAIEKHASTAGYTVDVVFVNASGPDVFDVKVDPNQWTTSGNFRAQSSAALAHELHHLLGLDDRYNYIQAHSANREMSLPDRLHWFREQLNRDLTLGPDPHATESIMGNRNKKPLDDDVCRVAGLDLARCVAIRTWGF
jgi:hypothetical protein